MESLVCRFLCSFSILSGGRSSWGRGGDPGEGSFLLFSCLFPVTGNTEEQENMFSCTVCLVTERRESLLQEHSENSSWELGFSCLGPPTGSLFWQLVFVVGLKMDQ